MKYSVDLAGATGPFVVEAELLYQPIGYRWANNLKAYDQASEPRVSFFSAMPNSITAGIPSDSTSLQTLQIESVLGGHLSNERR